LYNFFFSLTFGFHQVNNGNRHFCRELKNGGFRYFNNLQRIGEKFVSEDAVNVY